MGLIGKLVGALVLVVAGFIFLPKVWDQLDVDKYVDMAGLGGLGGLPGVPGGSVDATDAYVVVSAGRIESLELLMEQPANKTFHLEGSLWLLAGEAKEPSLAIVRDDDDSLAEGNATRGDIWKATFGGPLPEATSFRISLHPAEGDALQWDARLPSRLEEGRHQVTLMPVFT